MPWNLEENHTAGGDVRRRYAEAGNAHLSYRTVHCSGGSGYMYPAEQEGMELILKSGNFGQEDFFIRAARDI